MKTETAEMTGTESITYTTPCKQSTEVYYINSNSVGINCSSNIAYSTVSNGSSVKGNEYMIPCSGNIACSATTRVASQKEEPCDADVYEEVQTTTSY